MNFSMVELIGIKRDGNELDADALAWIVDEFTADRIPEYQMSALLMAIVLNGMSRQELAPWTEAILHSGDVLDLSGVHNPRVGKHSTGGVGDKISIPLAPIVAACGVAVPKISGRGLGHTGGTLDKLESIPGFSTIVDPSAFTDQLNTIGVVIAGQSDTLVPADKRLYALRDATGTVPSVPLISSSIMSKKLAENLDGLLLDVKFGSGAFMKTIEEADTLANTMVGIGESHGIRVTALLTNMSQPLGRAVGNANEIAESVAVLRGDGPADVTELTERFAVEMLLLSGVEDSEAASEQVRHAIDSGAAIDTLKRLVESQGGDVAVIDNTDLLPSAKNEHVVTAESHGFIDTCDAMAVGLAAVRLGAGRATRDDIIDHSVGFLIEAKVGDAVSVGNPLVRIAYNDEARLRSALDALQDAWTITEEPPSPRSLVAGRVP